MELFRLHAYTVEPQRSVADRTNPDGGAVNITSKLRKVIDDNVSAARFENRTRVDFQVDSQSRTNETRDLVRGFGFGGGSEARVAASALARRLSSAMDRRSGPCLFVAVAMREDNNRHVTLWSFPRDQAFRFSSRPGGSSIQIVTDVFSQTSKLRKAALFEGRNLKTHFLSGRVLDFQSNHTGHEVAEFWIRRFLQCESSLAGDAGTRLLAKALRKAMDSVQEVSEQQQLLVAALAVKQSPQQRWSLQDFADNFLQGEAKNAFLAAIPNDEGRKQSFDFHLDVFDSVSKFGIFALDTGVWVSSPFSEIGQSVKLTGTDEEKQLSCEGTIVQEKVRSRHA